MSQMNSSLASRCQAYLDGGPPPQMTDYVPGSMTEIIIAHGAKSRPLDDELRELADLILMEAEGFDSCEDRAVAEYMKRGAALVKEIVNG